VRRPFMTLLVFFGVLVSLLVLRLVPGLVLRMVLAIPRNHVTAFLHWLHRRRVDVALPRRNAPPAGARRRVKLVLVSSSLLMLALLATTAYWSSHTSSLMILLR
jgi:hypothetical protein